MQYVLNSTHTKSFEQWRNKNKKTAGQTIERAELGWSVRPAHIMVHLMVQSPLRPLEETPWGKRLTTQNNKIENPVQKQPLPRWQTPWVSLVEYQWGSWHRKLQFSWPIMSYILSWGAIVYLDLNHSKLHKLPSVIPLLSECWQFLFQNTAILLSSI